MNWWKETDISRGGWRLVNSWKRIIAVDDIFTKVLGCKAATHSSQG